MIPRHPLEKKRLGIKRERLEVSGRKVDREEEKNGLLRTRTVLSGHWAGM